MKDMGIIDHIIGCTVFRNDIGEYSISQKQYTKDVIFKYFPDSIMSINNPTDVNIILNTSMNAVSDSDIELMSSIPYRESIGSLLWLSMGTRPDITYAVSQVAKFNSDPGPQHWKAVKRIFQYLQQTVDYGSRLKVAVTSQLSQASSTWMPLEDTWMLTTQETQTPEGR